MASWVRTLLRNCSGSSAVLEIDIRCVVNDSGVIE